MPELALPQLRNELAIFQTGVDAGGAPGYVIHDPLRHKYFRVPDSAIRLLSFWHLGSVSQISAAADTTVEEVAGVAEFMSQSRLLQAPLEGLGAISAEYGRSKQSLVWRLLHSYLFFRIPLFDPEKVLDAVIPFARLFYSKTFFLVWLLVTATGLYLTMRQWDVYLQGFRNALSLKGAVHFGATLIILKIFHELGHGLMARHYKARVPVMGVAFMVMAPMLYTEVSDAWRLPKPKQRLMIAAAGVLTELAIAGVALCLWAFMPDSAVRSAMFFVSSTAWLTSLFVNLSPFMRFDGYHMFGDLLGMHNVGPRAFALARWKLKELLFGLGLLAPERLPLWLHRTLIIYAVSTCIYRLFLFLGIAALVYYMFPKVFGLPLGAIEIIFFIAFPVWIEISSWRTIGVSRLFRSGRAKLNLLIMAFGCALVVAPLDRHVSLPAVAVPLSETAVYPPEGAVVKSVSVRDKSEVKIGDVLFELDVPDLAYARRKAELRLAIIEDSLSRLAADAKDRAQSRVLSQEKQSVLEELRGYAEREKRLRVVSPIDGTVAEVSEQLVAGEWVPGTGLMARVIGHDGGLSVLGLAREREVDRLREGAHATFVPEDGIRPSITLKLMNIGMPGGEGPELRYLSSQHGGPVAIGKDSDARVMAIDPVLPVRFFSSEHVGNQAIRGTVTADAEPVSLAYLILSRVVSVLMRESGA